jgi:putative MFS transporter
MKHKDNKKLIFLSVLVAALGYFVDIYDLLLFSIVRIPSLKDLGITDPSELKSLGLTLLGWQMRGMLIGGILWGVLGDKKGRLSVLFGSILLYSIANICNGFVQTVEQYKWLRLIAGIGLAGELGAGITLVSEIMSKEKRGYGTTIVATIGIMGAIMAYWISRIWDWRSAYFVGGGLGLALLIMRMSVFETGMFKKMLTSNVEKGNFFKLFTDKTLLIKYIKCILVGFPTWFVVGILITLAPEFGKSFGMTEIPDAGLSVMWCYTGLTLGDLSSGLLSQVLKSRRKALIGFHLFSLATIFYYLLSHNISLPMFYFKVLIMGFGVGYWAVFVSNAAEQFGTNMRATVTTTVPNFARGMLDLIFRPLFMYFTVTLSLGNITTGIIIGVFTTVVAIITVYLMPETYGKNLDYYEHI